MIRRWFSQFPLALLCVVSALVITGVAGPQSVFADSTSPDDVTLQFVPAGALPNSAFGCNQDVCIDIRGNSTHVDQWNTYAFKDTSGTTCTQARWERPWGTIKVSKIICGTGTGLFVALWSPNSNFNPGQACNEWLFIPGRPCENIEV